MKTISTVLLILFFGNAANHFKKINSLEYGQAKDMHFKERINSIHSKVGDLTDIFSLHHIKEFNEVYFDPLKYRNSVLDYIKGPVNIENKIIAICLMTRLPLNEYVEMSNSYFVLYNKNIINEQLLDRCIFNEFDTNNTLVKNYRNPKIRLLFEAMLKSKTLSKQFKKNIMETLSGKRYNDLKRTGHIDS
jgi:hypothetical protein